MLLGLRDIQYHVLAIAARILFRADQFDGRRGQDSAESVENVLQGYADAGRDIVRLHAFAIGQHRESDSAPYVIDIDTVRSLSGIRDLGKRTIIRGLDHLADLRPRTIFFRAFAGTERRAEAQDGDAHVHGLRVLLD